MCEVESITGGGIMVAALYWFIYLRWAQNQ